MRMMDRDSTFLASIWSRFGTLTPLGRKVPLEPDKETPDTALPVHELNNQLTIILGNVRLMIRQLEGKKDQVNASDILARVYPIERAATKSAALIQQVQKDAP
jgi:hypothetical protein